MYQDFVIGKVILYISSYKATSLNQDKTFMARKFGINLSQKKIAIIEIIHLNKFKNEH